MFESVSCILNRRTLRSLKHIEFWYGSKINYCTSPRNFCDVGEAHVDHGRSASSLDNTTYNATFQRLFTTSSMQNDVCILVSTLVHQYA